jgi:hypothetical protein
LIANGYELGNHSATHADFSKLELDELVKEVGQVDEFLRDVLPDYRMESITYPFGKRPQPELQDIVATNTYNGLAYSYLVAFREGPSSAMVPPLHIKFDPYNAPRVRGSEGEIQDLWWFLENFEAHPEEKYISDGEARTVVLPTNQLENLNSEKLGDLEIITYEQ